MGAQRLVDSLRFAKERILVEQVRLVLDNVVSSTLPVVLLSFLMTFALSNPSNAAALLWWFIVVVVSKLAAYGAARKALANPIPPERARPLARFMVLSYGFNGLAWGALPWLTLDNSTPAGRVVTIAVMAGVIGSAMAQTSTIVPVFLAFASTTLSLVTLKLLMLGDPAFTALTGATVLYFISLMSLARNNAAASLSAIELRFENMDLMERLRAKTELAEEARCEAEHANVAKSRFLAAASHDLRQPIHAQTLFLDVLSRTELTEHQQTLLGNIRKATASSGEMLSTLLDFSRIEAGVVQPNYEVVRLQDVMDKLAAEFAHQANSKGLEYRTRSTGLMACTDPALLELILRNLLFNAIRYTDRGGILMAARRRGRDAIIEVWDTGVGIEEDQQREVFREFHQLGNPERDSRKGLGLGLAIAEGLVRTLGHTLSLRSVPGRGSVFRLHVPIATTEAATIRKSREIIAPFPQLHGVRVLVVEDDETVREGMVALLEDWGCRCDAVEGVEKAVEAARRRQPDIIISDYRLREQQTGTDAIDAVRSSLGRDLPGILITGDTAPERLNEAANSGVPLLHKPISPDELYQGVLVQLERAGALAAAEPGRAARGC